MQNSDINTQEFYLNNEKEELKNRYDSLKILYKRRIKELIKINQDIKEESNILYEKTLTEVQEKFDKLDIEFSNYKIKANQHYRDLVNKYEEKIEREVFRTQELLTKQISKMELELNRRQNLIYELNAKLSFCDRFNNELSTPERENRIDFTHYYDNILEDKYKNPKVLTLEINKLKERINNLDINNTLNSEVIERSGYTARKDDFSKKDFYNNKKNNVESKKEKEKDVMFNYEEKDDKPFSINESFKRSEPDSVEKNFRNINNQTETISHPTIVKSTLSKPTKSVETTEREHLRNPNISNNKLNTDFRKDLGRNLENTSRLNSRENKHTNSLENIKKLQNKSNNLESDIPN